MPPLVGGSQILISGLDSLMFNCRDWSICCPTHSLRCLISILLQWASPPFSPHQEMTTPYFSWFSPIFLTLCCILSSFFSHPNWSNNNSWCISSKCIQNQLPPHHLHQHYPRSGRHHSSSELPQRPPDRSSCCFSYLPLVFWQQNNHGTLVKIYIRPLLKYTSDRVILLFITLQWLSPHSSHKPECLQWPHMIPLSLFSNLISVYFLIGLFIISRVCLLTLLQV